MVNTFYDIVSRSGRQIDRAFVTIQDKQLVVKCVNAAMIVDSDHESVRIKMVIEKIEKPLQTKRKGRQQKDAGNTFGQDACPQLRADGVARVLQIYEDSAAFSKTPHGKFESLMKAVTTTLDSVNDKERQAKGWCDKNDWVLEIAMSARIVASRKYALCKTAPHLKAFREARSQVVKVKRRAKNKWLLEMVEKCTFRLLPGGAKSTDPKYIWSFVTRLMRGADKWRQWNYTNIQNTLGEIGTSPSDNADNFAAFYNTLYDNDGVEGGKADAHLFQVTMRCS